MKKRCCVYIVVEFVSVVWDLNGWPAFAFGDCEPQLPNVYPLTLCFLQKSVYQTHTHTHTVAKVHRKQSALKHSLLQKEGIGERASL